MSVTHFAVLQMANHTASNRKSWPNFSLFKKRFARDKKGGTTIEFAIVIFPFLACLFAIMEVALIFFAGQVLEEAVGDADRLLLTGQAQTANFTATDFKNAICTNQLKLLFNCQNIQIDVRTVNSFSAANLTAPVNTTTKVVDTSGFTYQPGNACNIVVVRVIYEWPTFVRYMGLDMSTLADGNHLLMSTAAFRNEPYGVGFC
jgi:Flp pilus assembly protein TadG